MSAASVVGLCWLVEPPLWVSAFELAQRCPQECWLVYRYKLALAAPRVDSSRPGLMLAGG